MTVDGRIEPRSILVAALGRHEVILGLPWLEARNPLIDWQRKALNFLENQRVTGGNLGVDITTITLEQANEISEANIERCFDSDQASTEHQHNYSVSDWVPRVHGCLFGEGSGNATGPHKI